MANMVDVLIVGGGPAGLSAALALARQDHSSIIFDSGSYRNDPTDFMHLIPGFDGEVPANFRATARANISSGYDCVSFRNVGVAAIQRAEAGLFELIDDHDQRWLGRKVILATGVQDVFPEIEGFAECWGRSIFQCLLCKGYEERGCISAGVLAVGPLQYVPQALHVARQVTRLSPQVTLYTNGSESVAAELVSAFGTTTQMRVDRRVIKRFIPGPRGTGVGIEFEDGSSTKEGFLAHQPATKSRAVPFIEQLGLNVLPTGDVEAPQPFFQTSATGVFAAGDHTSFLLKNVPNAIFSGHAAAQGAASQIQAEAHGQNPLFV